MSIVEFNHLKLNDFIYSHIHSSKKIINFHQKSNSVKSYSVRDLHDEIQRVKPIFSKSISKGEVIFISWRLSFEFIVYFLALLELEVIPAPLFPKEDFIFAEYIKYLLEYKNKTGISKILVPNEISEELLTQGFEVIKYEIEIDKFKTRNNPQVPYCLDLGKYQDVSFIQFPFLNQNISTEGIIYSHRKMLKNLLSIKGNLNLPDDLKSAFVGGLSDELGLFGGVLLPLCLGSEQHYFLAKDFEENPKEFLDVTYENKIQLWFGDVKLYDRISRHEFNLSEKYDFSKLKFCLCSGKSLNYYTFESFKIKFAPFKWEESSFINFYFQPANYLFSSFLKEHRDLNFIVLNQQKIVSLGRANPGVQLKIVDQNNYILGEDQEGLVCVKSETLCLGVLNSQFISQQTTFENSWFYTHEIGFIENGELYLSRVYLEKYMSKGKLQSISELESSLLGHLKKYQFIKDVLVLSKENRRNHFELRIGIIYKFDLKLYLPLLKKKIVTEIAKKFEIKTENIKFISEKKIAKAAHRNHKKLELYHLCKFQ